MEAGRSPSMVVTTEESQDAAPVRKNLVDRMMHADVARRLFGADDQEAAAVGVAATVGRFVILDRIGAGGMATVYRAYDPELHRRIALKLLLPATEEQLGRRGRFRREALALAQLTHPNVVTIYEVGVFAGELFIAMEYVEGVDLMRWLRDNPVGGRERFERALALLRQAGLGLAAAHAAGLVHRDFKPSNVLIGKDGRVKVADFGLARTGDESSSENTTGPTSAGELTRTGTTVGTPRYMSPEQQLGRTVDARTDQFSFCVAAWEVLFGAPPWRGLPDPDAPPTAPAWAPRWLRAVLLRGLGTDPAKRWEDMQTLLAALRRGQPRRGVRYVALGAAVLAMGGGGALYARDRIEARTIAACEAEGSTIADVWSDAQHPELRAAMLDSGLSYAEASIDATLGYLDDYATTWADARTQTCMRRDVTGEWNADTAERAQWCLTQASDELEVLVDELRRGEPTAVRESVRLSAGLPRFDACLDSLALRTLPAPPPEQQTDARAVRRDLARARAMGEAGRPVEALELARQSLADSETLGWSPLEAAARTRVGILLEKTGDVANAEVELEAAYFTAVKAHAYSEAAVAAEHLVSTVGVTLARHDEGLRWARHAEVVREQLPDPTGIRLAAALTNRANIHSARREIERSRALHEEALALFEKALGPNHPLVGGSLHNLGSLAMAQGDYARAQELGERSLEIGEQVLGPDHPDVGSTRLGLASVAYIVGDHDRARAMLEAGLSSLARARGPDHPDLVQGFVLLGALHNERDDYPQARAAFERALEISEAAFGPDHPEVALALDNVALVARREGDFESARRMYERSLAIAEQRLGADNVELAFSLLGLCEVAIADGRAAEAVELAQRAVDLRDKGGARASLRGRARFILAQAQWAAGKDRAQAIETARSSLEIHRSSTGDDTGEIGEVEAWLAEHTAEAG